MSFKKLFPEHFKDESDIKELWRSCVFVFDTSVICDLYRYSDSTRESLLKIMEKIKSRVWLPNRVADEYLRNRAGIITKQEKFYTEAINAIKNLEDELNQKRKHPFISKKLHDEFESLSKNLKEELEENRKNYLSKISNDDIKDRIAQIFDGNVGKPYSLDEIKSILEEGRTRFDEKIPPGYMDRSKDKESEELTKFDEECRPYGDFIVWKQIIDKALEEGVDVILVTNDAKADWWKIENNKTIGPRYELIKEFEDATSKKFHMYKPDRFLEFAQEVFEEDVDKRALEEMKEMNVLVKNNSKVLSDINEFEYAVAKNWEDSHNLVSNILQLRKEKDKLERDFIEVQDLINKARQEQESISLIAYSEDPGSDRNKTDELLKKISRIKENINLYYKEQEYILGRKKQINEAIGDWQSKLL